jgi:hypothetical protein
MRAVRAVHVRALVVFVAAVSSFIIIEQWRGLRVMETDAKYAKLEQDARELRRANAELRHRSEALSEIPFCQDRDGGKQPLAVPRVGDTDKPEEEENRYLLPPLRKVCEERHAIRETLGGSHDMRSWSTPNPMTLPQDLPLFKGQRQPFSGCKWEKGTEGSEVCVWPAAQASVQVHYGASVSMEHVKAFGVCGEAGKEDVYMDSWTSGAASEVIDEVFVPLDIAQSAYYAHFFDCLMPKLVYVLELRSQMPKFYANLRVYLPKSYASKNTFKILRHLNVTWTHDWPLQKRFKAIVWVCHTPEISPPQGAAIVKAVQRSPRREEP